jgi:malonyl CoA-acyl carrier protein transacylase
LRAAFNSLHGYSLGLMTVAMLAGVVALFAVARRKK